MTARTRGGPFRRQSLRRRVSWGVGPEGVLSISSGTPALFPNGSEAGLDDLTLVRIRGWVSIMLTGTNTALGGFPRIGVGICNVTQNAFGVGLTAVPSPLTDIAWDGWIWHEMLTVQGASSTLDRQDPYATQRVQIDNKAMRKTHLTDTIVGVLETSGEVGAATIHAVMNTRLLDKLP